MHLHSTELGLDVDIVYCTISCRDSVTDAEDWNNHVSQLFDFRLYEKIERDGRPVLSLC